MNVDRSALDLPQLLIRLLGVLIGVLSLGTPAATANAGADASVAPYVYDALPNNGAFSEDARPVAVGLSRGIALPHNLAPAVESPGSSTTPPRLFVAPQTPPPIKPGAVDGPTSGKSFGQGTKDSVVAENLEVTGGDVLVCVWCRMETPNPHIDHAVPKSHGGNATITNGQVACPHCNVSRSNGPHRVNPPKGYEGPWPAVVAGSGLMSVGEAQHLEPVWRERSNFIIGADVSAYSDLADREQLWARQIDDDRFELCCIPFFLYDVALGDVVETAPVGDRKYVLNRVVESSGRFVFRVAFGESFHPREAVARELEAMGALLEWSSPNLLAVDARDADHAQEIANHLAQAEADGRLVFETGRSA